MQNINFRKLTFDDKEFILLIASWYEKEWNIPVEKTLKNLYDVLNDDGQFQLLMIQNGVPIATAGIYRHVGIINQIPYLEVYKNWLALVYVKPEYRNFGHGTALCYQLELFAKKIGINCLTLFTDSAPDFYRKSGWKDLANFQINKRGIVLMEKILMVENSECYFT